MEYFTRLSPPFLQADPVVVVLQCRDAPHVDPAPVLYLFQTTDPTAAENIACRRLEGIAQRLDVVQYGLKIGDFPLIRDAVAGICVIADQTGLQEVSLAASHVANCTEQGGGIALAATVARLERGFAIAVSEVWNFRSIG